MNYPDTIENLIDCFKKYPGVGAKSAERFALATLSLDSELIEVFAHSLIDSKKKIRKCERCNYYSEDKLCKICSDKTRNKDIICIVEDPKNVKMLEDTHIFDGYYYVLNGK